MDTLRFFLRAGLRAFQHDLRAASLGAPVAPALEELGGVEKRLSALDLERRGLPEELVDVFDCVSEVREALDTLEAAINFNPRQLLGKESLSDMATTEAVERLRATRRLPTDKEVDFVSTDEVEEHILRFAARIASERLAFFPEKILARPGIREFDRLLEKILAEIAAANGRMELARPRIYALWADAFTLAYREELTDADLTYGCGGEA
jgi:hypothetical protein